MSYSLSDYGDMMGDNIRMDAYAAALEQHIGSDTVVLDIGCGCGIFSLLACKLGARHVYGIEPNPAVHIARRLAEANGMADRITFYDSRSEDVTLPEQATLLVSDLRGALPVYGNHFRILKDARERLLTGDAVILPKRDRLYACLVNAPDNYDRHVRPWQENTFGIDFSIAQQQLVNMWGTSRVTAEQMVTQPQLWTELDYHNDLPATIDKALQWKIDRPTTAHGLYLWFTCDVCDGVSYSAAPDCDERPEVYGSGFFPFESPLELTPASQVSVRLVADGLQGDFVFHWQTTVLGTDGTELQTFQQSTFRHEVFSPGVFARRADSYVPEMGEDGQVDLMILSGIQAGKPLGEIARQGAAEFPSRFPSWQIAMGHIGDLSQAYDIRPH